mmetsp:Transcript_18065/g.32684  ORF Transcript_18065/g.32684 Transcript_18065/m.32684 type:complete len:113 (+) Transcript_18065:199-537(+)
MQKQLYREKATVPNRMKSVACFPPSRAARPRSMMDGINDDDAAPRRLNAHECEEIVATNSTSYERRLSADDGIAASSSARTSAPTEMSAAENIGAFRARCESPIDSAVSLYA